MIITRVQANVKKLFTRGNRGIRAGIRRPSGRATNLTLALAMLLMLGAPDAQAQTPGFPCETIRVKLDGPKEPLKDKPLVAMNAILPPRSLELVTDNKKPADIEVTFTVTSRMTKDDIRISGLIASSKMKIASDSVPLSQHDYPNGRNSIDYGWNENGDDYMNVYLKEALDKYLKTHRAGLAIDVTPKDAKVQFKINGADVMTTSPNSIGCLKIGDKITVTAMRDGYQPYESKYEATQNPSEVKKVDLLPSVKPSPPSIIPWIVGASLAVIVAVLAIAVLRRKPIRRSIPQSPPPHPPVSGTPGAPLKILYLSANQQDKDPLRIEKEIRELNNLDEDRKKIQFFDVTWNSVKEVLLAFNKHNPDVVHFSGHGKSEGIMVIENGREVRASKEWLQKLFKAFQGSENRIRLVVLNACYSDQIGEVLCDTVGMTIGTTGALPDESAIQFATRFYGAVLHGCSVNEAFKQGRLPEVEQKLRFDTNHEKSSRGGIIRVYNTQRPKEMFVLSYKDGIDPDKVVLSVRGA